LSRDLQLNCVISFFFGLHLVLHAYAARFDVTDTVALFVFTFCELNRPYSMQDNMEQGCVSPSQDVGAELSWTA